MGLAHRLHMFSPVADFRYPELSVQRPELPCRGCGCTALERRAARSQGNGTVAVPCGAGEGARAAGAGDAA
jgi:hypothetical protein